MTDLGSDKTDRIKQIIISMQSIYVVSKKLFSPFFHFIICTGLS
jgi:hypothetical protein